MRLFSMLIAVLIGDQLSKYVIVTSLEIGEKYPIFDDFFNITYIHNPGAAFGMMEGRIWFFIIAALVVVAGIIYYDIRYKPPHIVQYALGLIAGGALGNLVDRIFYKSVIDFISIGWWPVFNLADVAIVAGSTVLVVFIFYDEKHEVKNG